ncbi:hypothetical protein [Haloarchaeobius sp. HME9146]|uniref:hypothetical protein n=1 Tax=Haloarchaeobius sp. HME9146 TaxID=2978732 RepID=UPI0021BF270C|nr:hypothetical protein [Haloarchaeobius sp. HME9146]MCT9098515.1 hypothetical protein [Haloarchaeobius sp. HME9146]
MVRNFEDNDKGKKVMSTDGDMIGRVDNVAGGKAYIKPDSTLSRGMRKKLGWTDEKKDTFELEHDAVEAISDDEIHVKADF